MHNYFLLFAPQQSPFLLYRLSTRLERVKERGVSGCGIESCARAETASDVLVVWGATPRTAGYGLGFPDTLFLSTIQSYGLYTI